MTKRELARVGIELRFEDNVRAWMRRGWVELALYLWNQDAFNAYVAKRNVRNRIFEEDGA